MRKKRSKGSTDDAAMFTDPPVAHIAPEDIQQKEFGVARLGGYKMHEVDEFLDEVTTALGELIAENERLRGGAVQPFLDRERDFLRSLGTLVQEHMENVREMARAMPSAVAPIAAEGMAPDTEDSPEAPGSGAPAAQPTEAIAASPATQPVGESVATYGPEEAAGSPPTEPIRLEEAQPARTGGDEGGLRELFWGEDE